MIEGPRRKTGEEFKKFIDDLRSQAADAWGEVQQALDETAADAMVQEWLGAARKEEKTSSVEPAQKSHCHDDFRRKVLEDVSDEIHDTALEKGWWENERNTGEALALMHSELSEALEADRAGNPPDDKIPEFSGMEAELADTMIRILDFAKGTDLDVIGAMLAKIDFNKGREYKHGGKSY